MAIQSDETLVTKGDLKTLYTDKILPYLGGNAMMQTNVSDYFSEDEKIVGLFTDGKPIYQKTFTGTTSATTSSDSVAGAITNLDTLVNSNGTIFLVGTWGVNQHSLPYNNVVEYYIDTSNQVIIHKQNEIANTKQYMVTIQYTKTTDTASSALTTPGCYDVNRPDLWPVDQEIFFGNGLYGYRKTGTNVTVPKQSRTDIVLITTGNANTKIYNSGGFLENSNWKYAIPSSHTTGNGDQFIWFNKTNSTWTQNSIIFYISNNSTTAALNYTNYDVWVTYTK